MVKINFVFLWSLGSMRSLSTPPVILESNYTLELQSSFQIEIMPDKNYNRSGIIIHPSVGFLIAKLCFSLLLKKLPDNPWFFFTMRVALGSTASKLTLRTENSGEKKSLKYRKIFGFSYHPTDQNWELNITQWLLSCAEFWCKNTIFF